jgi:anti-sigma regulatory factor (Ser/Thr protein kinase)/ABC-type transporter Mla MlaB component
MEYLSLSGDLTRASAVEKVLTLSTSADAASEICLDAGFVERADAVAAAALRLRIARHHREHEQGTVTLVLPKEPELAARLSALLQPPPERVTLVGQVDQQPPANYSLVPATIVSDSHAAVALGGATLDACERARISRRRSMFITEAAMELADNAVVHAQAATDAPVVALTSVARGSQIELAVLDTGHGIAESDDPREALRAIPRRALDADPGFLADILQRAREAQVQVQVQILAGTGRLLWTAMQHRTAAARYLPGTTVILRIAGERSLARPSSSDSDG